MIRPSLPPLAREYADLVRQRLGAQIKRIILFGSRARGDATSTSDYDILLLVENNTPEVREAVLDADLEMLDRHQALFSTMVYEGAEWHHRHNLPWAWNIAQEGLSL